jgi:PKD repeat protein
MITLMFKEIVSKLSLSPSAASELAFYARRLKQEKITRTFSAIAAVLVIGLQVATIAAPSTSSNAASPGDLIHGGFVSRDDLLNSYDASSELKAVYKYFGVTRTELANAKLATINSRDHSLQSLSRVAHESGEGSLTIAGHTYYYRPLFHADTGANITGGSSYKVLEGYSTTSHNYFAIMFICGNIVFKTVPKPPVPPTPTPKPSPPPVAAALACLDLNGSVGSGSVPLKVNYIGVGSATGQTITAYIFDYGDGVSETKTTTTASHTYVKAGKWTATLRVKGSKGATTAVSPACSFAVNATTPPAAFTKSKSALNTTQNIDATTQPAHAGDIIHYTLTTKNVGGTTENYVVVEHLEDVLEYADVTDVGGATLADSVLTWPGVSLAPGQTIIKTFTAQVKDPIPATPVGSSDPYSFDLRMDNVYGTAVQIKLQPPLPKEFEQTSQQLPATGGAMSTLIVLAVTGMSLFFYFRNRQLLAEIRLLRHDYDGGIQ